MGTSPTPDQSSFSADVTWLYSGLTLPEPLRIVDCMPSLSTIMGERKMHGNEFQGWNGGGRWTGRGRGGAVSKQPAGATTTKGGGVPRRTEPPRPRVDASEGGEGLGGRDRKGGGGSSQQTNSRRQHDQEWRHTSREVPRPRVDASAGGTSKGAAP